MERPSPTATALADAVNTGAGRGQNEVGLSFTSFLASLATGTALFGIQFALFHILKSRFPRIYAPKTYLVPQRERVSPPPPGFLTWVRATFKTSNSEFIQKCGLDAYLFLRYLRMLLKIFVPAAIVILPILLPLNSVGKNNGTSGMDIFGWQNIGSEKADRFWAHLILAVLLISYVCFVFFDELRKFIRLRQAYLTSPQHRLRASATTVLVSSIPRKWLSNEALDGLFDVFPGGIRNIWINRNFDELTEKVRLRDWYARRLEAAETQLIRDARRAHLKMVHRTEKQAGRQRTRAERKEDAAARDRQAQQMAAAGGLSSGDPHQTPHTLQEALEEDDRSSSLSRSKKDSQHFRVPIPVIGSGIEVVGQSVGKLGQKVVGSVFDGFKKVAQDVEDRLEVGETGTGIGLDGTPVAQQTLDDVERSGGGGGGDSTIKVSNSNANQDRGACAEDLAVTEATKSPPHGPQYGDPPLPHEAAGEQHRSSRWPVRTGGSYGIPSPQPRRKEEDEFPLNAASPVRPGGRVEGTASDEPRPSNVGNGGGKASPKYLFWGRKSPAESSGGVNKTEKTPRERQMAYDEAQCQDDESATWRRYLKPGDRETMRLSLFPGLSWWPSIPLIGRKVDVIYWCRTELARLNQEIESDQANPERFPLMNSAFIQFNHQVAAHMACQSLSHHIPKHMAPRWVEISPSDVLWDNLSMTWWERYLRTTVVLVCIVGLTIAWAFPVTFTGLLSQVSYLAGVKWLRWIADLPTAVLSIVQGALPPALLALLLFVLPLILRSLADQQGVPTGVARELSVQTFFFGFLFVQVFLVVSISAGITSTIQHLLNDPLSVPRTLADNLPKASNYFFSYMILQALSVSAGALMQVASLIGIFIFGPLMDNTARQKFNRNVKLQSVQWGTFFPIYTNLAAIGLIYSIISPLILVFNIITFSLFWIVYRYVTLYVNRVRIDTGGLLFPKAINQLFTGLYVMELCLIGLFFLVRTCTPHAIIMIVVLLLTAIYQYLLNNAFGPLFKYIPISLEDDAVRRDEEFARAQSKRWNLVQEEEDGDDLHEVLKEREERELRQGPDGEEIALRNMGSTRGSTPGPNAPVLPLDTGANGNLRDSPLANRRQRHLSPSSHQMASAGKDLESQRAVGDILFSGISDEIEDLTPDERDKLVRRAFQHAALRARRPVIWIPRDELGISDDEIRRTQRFNEKYIWISNAFTALDGKTRVLIKRAPPDFSELDLIQL